MPTFPEWWNCDLSFTSHAELRMEPGQSPWVAIVEPDAEVALLVVATVYEVSQ